MNRFLFLIFLSLTNYLTAQSIVVNPVSSPESILDAEELTIEVLVDGGQCSSISNFQLTDNSLEAPYPSEDRSWGYFEKGSSNFPFEKGIILTTGYAKRAEGPSEGIVNDGDYYWGADDMGFVGDPDAYYLINLSTGGTLEILSKNYTIFEFDFTPYSNEISFNYVFASEEYPIWDCNVYNDVFAFIISGPGITNDPGLTGKNIALLSNGQYVTVNNVNNDYCGDDEFFVPGPFLDIQHGGRTTPLTAYSQVIPGETYHIKLLISDANDTWYDSAVFLEAGSFDLSSSITDETGIELGNEQIICDEEQYILQVDQTSTDAEIRWYFNDVLIPGETGELITATQSGTYKVEVDAIGCLQTDTIDLFFKESPEVINVTDSICSSGISIINLTDYEDQLYDSNEEVTFRYFLSFESARDLNPIDLITNPENFELNGTITIYVRIENEAGCHSIAELTLVINTIHEILSDNLTKCDDPYLVNDGIETFDLIQMGNEIAAILNSNENDITYYLTLENARNGVDSIIDPTEFENTTNPQTIYARAENSDGGCAGIAEFQIEVLPVPEFELPGYIAFCGVDETSYQFSDNFATYTWKDANGNIIGNSAMIEFQNEGIYTLEVTANMNSCPAIREVEVIFDNEPIITNIEVNENTVTVFPTGGEPPYEYSYNDGLTWHDYFVLTDVPPGIYSMLVRSKYGCISEGKTFGVLGIPNIITPNGDGYNDYWEIRALEMYPDAYIKIFDRYGKIFVDRKMGNNFRWDGKYLGNPLPSADYWYIITIEKDKSISGHVSIKNE